MINNVARKILTFYLSNAVMNPYPSRQPLQPPTSLGPLLCSRNSSIVIGQFLGLTNSNAEYKLLLTAELEIYHQTHLVGGDQTAQYQ